jgi:hypothetical protein
LISANPATVKVGSVYAEAGHDELWSATDKNLGESILLDGASTMHITLDTTTTGTQTINYVVTDLTSLTSPAPQPAQA